MERKKAVGYIRSLANKESGLIQQSMIERFCMYNDLDCVNLYTDYEKRNNRTPEERGRASMLGLNPVKWTRVYEQWEQMLVDIIRGEHVDYILVDTCYRLFISVEVKTAFNNICKKHNVQVIEVGDYLPPADNREQANALAIYLSTNETSVKTKPVTNSIDSAYAYAYGKYADWQISLFLERKEGNKKVLRKLEENLEQLNLVVISRVQHVTRHTYGFVKKINSFLCKGVEVESVPYGRMSVKQGDDMLKQKLKVATYQCEAICDSELVKHKCLVFVTCKAPGWEIKETYADDKSSIYSRTNLNRLISDSDNYDMLLVDEFKHITKDSKFFMDVLKNVRIPIFSIKEGVMVHEG